MTNLETAIATLAAHREARRWDDAIVAADLLTRLGIDQNGEHGLSDPHPEVAPSEVTAPQ